MVTKTKSFHIADLLAHIEVAQTISSTFVLQNLDQSNIATSNTYQYIIYYYYYSVYLRTMPKSDNKQKKCMHHWVIDSPHGQMSYAKCKLCGAVAEFYNILIDAFARRKVVYLQESSLDLPR